MRILGSRDLDCRCKNDLEARNLLEVTVKGQSVNLTKRSTLLQNRVQAQLHIWSTNIQSRSLKHPIVVICAIVWIGRELTGRSHIIVQWR